MMTYADTHWMSLTNWKTLTNKANKYVSRGQNNVALPYYMEALAEAERILDMALMSEHRSTTTIPTYIIACHNLSDFFAKQGDCENQQAFLEKPYRRLVDMMNDSHTPEAIRLQSSSGLSIVLMPLLDWLQSSSRRTTQTQQLLTEVQTLVQPVPTPLH